jgi:hypothetical protein
LPILAQPLPDLDDLPPEVRRGSLLVRALLILVALGIALGAALWFSKDDSEIDREASVPAPLVPPRPAESPPPPPPPPVDALSPESRNELAGSPSAPEPTVTAEGAVAKTPAGEPQPAARRRRVPPRPGWRAAPSEVLSPESAPVAEPAEAPPEGSPAGESSPAPAEPPEAPPVAPPGGSDSEYRYGI